MAWDEGGGNGGCTESEHEGAGGRERESVCVCVGGHLSDTEMYIKEG